MDAYQPVRDSYFIKRMMIPYFSQVYQALIDKSTKSYLDIKKTKQYLGLPEPIADRICQQINSNGDERVDHDEFIQFFVTALMGNHQQKIRIAFKCYDPDNMDYITKKEVKYILKHIPINFEGRYGISFGTFESEAITTREFMQH